MATAWRDFRLSRFRDMIGAHQNMNGLHDLTTPFSGWFVICRLALATINLPTKYEVSNYAHYKDMMTRVSAADDRPARRRGSAHAKYSESHHRVIKPFLPLGLTAEYRSWRWMWSTVADDRQKFRTLTGELSWQRLRRTAVPEIRLVPTKVYCSRDLTTPLSGMVCHPWASTCHRQSTYQTWSL